MNALNPYRFVGGPRPTGEHFVVRAALTRQIAEVWRLPGRPGNLSVIGFHRVGKTSLVHRALSGVDRDDLGVVRLSMGLQTSMFDLFRTLVRDVAGVFPHVPALAELSRSARETRDWIELHSRVSAFFTELRHAELHVLVVLDDFDRAPLVAGDLSGFQLLRTLVSEAAYPVGLVTVSRRRILDIERTATDGGSRLDLVMARRLHVGPFTAAEAGELVDRSRQAEVDLGAVVHELYARSGLHPYLLGLLCREVVAHHQRTGVVDVAAATAELAPAFHSHFTLMTGTIDQDTAGRGGELLRELAAEARVEADSQELQQLVDLGIVTRNGSDVRLFSGEFAAFTRDPDGYRSGERERTTPFRCTALVVATEWSSAHGGLSTFNQRLCVALAAERVRVFCMVLEATPDEVAEAAGQGVTLLHRPAVIWEPAQGRLIREPELPAGVTVDLVIGHGRITGYPALVQGSDHFRDAKRVHFVHMDPDEIEWHKLDGDDDAVETAESRKRIELALGRAADRMVAVGPRLHATFTSAMSRRTDRDPLRFDPGFDMDDPSPRKIPGGSPISVLLMGRMEDATLKGVDLAARACGIVAGWRKERNLRRVELVVRGLPRDDAMAQVARLREWAGDPRLSIVPRHYTTDAETLADDMERASLLLMPSRGEGFGLAGLEAIVAGTPALVSDASGLADLLADVLPPDRAAQVVVPVTNDFDHDVEVWARSVERMLLGIDMEFLAAQRMREELAATHTWAASADRLLKDLGFRRP